MSDEAIHIASISGGKDSTATKLILIERGIPHISVFADTGNEHPLTYEYIDYLEKQFGPITRVRADFTRQIEGKRKYIAEKWPGKGIPASTIEQALAILRPTGIPFLDLCLWKGCFPSTRRRFCSSELKHQPIHFQVVDPLLEQGREVVSWQGVRADESASRAMLPPIQDVGGGLWIYRPILDFTAEDVFDLARRHGIKPNPLYKLGMGRVGCMPCIHARKEELRNIANRFPAEIDRIREWERLVGQASKRGVASFFAADKTPQGRECTSGRGNYDQLVAAGEPIHEFRIDQVVEWTKTGRGGRQYDLMAGDAPQCSSLYGLCE